MIQCFLVDTSMTPVGELTEVQYVCAKVVGSWARLYIHIYIYHTTGSLFS